MCTRSYPECSVYGEGCGADGECDMDSSTENGNNSDSLDPTRRHGSVTAKSDYLSDYKWMSSYMMKTVCGSVSFVPKKEMKRQL